MRDKAIRRKIEERRESLMRSNPNILGVGANVKDGKIQNFIYYTRAKVIVRETIERANECEKPTRQRAIR